MIDVVSVCNGYLAILRRASRLLSVPLLRLMYIALTRSHLEYCSALYAAAAKTHLEKLDVIQRKAARIILGAPHDAHSEPLLNTLHLESLQNRREAHMIKLVTSIISANCHPCRFEQPVRRQLRRLLNCSYLENGHGTQKIWRCRGYSVEQSSLKHQRASYSSSSRC